MLRAREFTIILLKKKNVEPVIAPYGATRCKVAFSIDVAATLRDFSL